MCIVIPTDTV